MIAGLDMGLLDVGPSSFLYLFHHTHTFSLPLKLCFQATQQIMNLYKMFVSVDATQVEINPFGETPDGRGVAF